MNSFVGFMTSAAGRWTRIIAGLVLIAAGLFAVGGTGGYILAAVGLLPLLAGVSDFCVFAPLFGFPLGGAACRAKNEKR
jgi:hypothetical protein